MKQQKQKPFREQKQVRGHQGLLSPYWNNQTSKYKSKLLIEKESHAQGNNFSSSIKQFERMKASLDNPYQLKSTVLPSNFNQRHLMHKNQTFFNSSILDKKWLSDKLDKRSININDEERTQIKPALYATQSVEPAKHYLFQSRVTDDQKISQRFYKKEKLQKNASEEILPFIARLKKSMTQRLNNRYANFSKSEKQIDIVEKYLRSNAYDTTNTIKSSIDKLYNFSWEKEEETPYLPNSNIHSHNEEKNTVSLNDKMEKSFPKSTGNLLKTKTFDETSQLENYNFLNSSKQIYQKERAAEKIYLNVSSTRNAYPNLLPPYKDKQKLQIPNHHIKPTNYSENLTDKFQDAKLKDFIIIKKLGEGRFGVVQSAIHKRTGAIFALKCISRKQILKHGLVGQLSLQLRIQSCLKSPFIVELYGWFEDVNLYIVLQYMEGGTLYGLMKQKGKIQCVDAALKIKQVAEAVNTMQEKGIVHRDIKPENVVLSFGTCKLCDFGWATYCNEERRKTYCGTTDYVAPEIVMGLEYDVAVDLWCLGILIFELVVGKAPFYHISTKETMRKIMNVDEKSVLYPAWLDSACQNLIKRLLKKNPEERISVKQLLKHTWIINVDNS